MGIDVFAWMRLLQRGVNYDWNDTWARVGVGGLFVVLETAVQVSKCF